MSRLASLGLHHRSGLVRKLTAGLLGPSRVVCRLRARDEAYVAQPPVLANSFPKSGTHLLDQIVEVFPDRVNYGSFLASMTSSFRFRERSLESTVAFIHSFVPGEVVRGHLFHSPESAAALRERRTVHYFIYRDPRDVIVSEAHYLRTMNRWHRLHRYFRDQPTLADAMSLAIGGLSAPEPGIDYSDVAARFARYAGWLARDDVCPVRFEDLGGERREATVRGMVRFYAGRASVPIDEERLVQAALRAIDPRKSHTFRKGRQGGWRESFSEDHRQQFKEVAGRLLIDLGYEQGMDW